MSKITKIVARQVFDSRGNPTIEAEVFSKNISAKAICPSGASTGSYEAYEKRDLNNKKYLGKSVFKAIHLINKKISKKIKKQKINELNLSPYQKRVLMESRMEEGHRMFDDLVKVPLIFSGLNIPLNKKISQQVRHIDIFPTIEDMISLPKKQNVDGCSLLPLMQDKFFPDSYVHHILNHMYFFVLA